MPSVCAGTPDRIPRTRTLLAACWTRAPLETLAERLATRTSNSFGKAPEQLRRVLDDLETVEPRLRQVADYEVRTTVPLNEVVATVLRLVGA
jgi:hypothetical protein